MSGNDPDKLTRVSLLGLVGLGNLLSREDMFPVLKNLNLVFHLFSGSESYFDDNRITVEDFLFRELYTLRMVGKVRVKVTYEEKTRAE